MHPTIFFSSAYYKQSVMKKPFPSVFKWILLLLCLSACSKRETNSLVESSIVQGEELQGLDLFETSLYFLRKEAHLTHQGKIELLQTLQSRIQADESSMDYIQRRLDLEKRVLASTLDDLDAMEQQLTKANGRVYRYYKSDASGVEEGLLLLNENEELIRKWTEVK